MQKRVLSLLVDNTAGVTTRVSGLFSRRGYNIDSITGGVTADERFSRITVVCSGDELILEQITNQLAKLVDVRDIKILEPDNSVCHELMMIKVAAKTGAETGTHFHSGCFPCESRRRKCGFHDTGDDR